MKPTSRIHYNAKIARNLICGRSFREYGCAVLFDEELERDQGTLYFAVYLDNKTADVSGALAKETALRIAANYSMAFN